MKKLFTTFLMTMVATAPFCFNTLVADSQTILLTEDEARIKFNELKDLEKITLDEDFFQLANFFLSESDQVLFVDLREDYCAMPAYWADGFHGHLNESPDTLEEIDNWYFQEVLATMRIRIEEGKYQLNQSNLATLQAITDSEFVENFKDRYVRFQIGDGYLQNDLFLDQLAQHIDDASNRIHVHYLPGKETATLFCLLDSTTAEKKLENKQFMNNNYVTQRTTIDDKTLLHSSGVSFPQRVSRSESDSSYYKLSSDCSIGIHAECIWGGNEESKGSLTVNGSISDNRGNSIHGSYGYTSDGKSKATADAITRDRERERNR